MSTTPLPDVPVQIVNNGPDTFAVNYKFADEHDNITGDALPDDIQDLLDVWQKEARKTHEPVQTDLTFTYLVGTTSYTQPLFIRSHGSSTWSWLLFCDDLRVDLAPGTLNKGLFCKIIFSSHLLHMIGAERSIAEAESMLYDFLHVNMHKQASEVHLCVDITGFDFSVLNLALGGQLPFVSRVCNIRDRPVVPTEEEQHCNLSPQDLQKVESKIEQEIAEFNQAQEMIPLGQVLTTHRKIATIDFGSHASDISCQIYNKSQEVKKHKKEWFCPIWCDNGWDRKSTVWRVEFRFKRAFLRRYELDEAYMVVELFHLLWKYATEQWLRMVDVDAATGVNISRLPTHPVWATIQHAYDPQQQETINREHALCDENRLAYAAEKKPLQTIAQSETARRYAAASPLLDECLFSIPDLYQPVEKAVHTQLLQEATAIEDTLQDEPVKVLRVLAHESIATLSPVQLQNVLDRLVPLSLKDVVRTVLVKQEKRIAKKEACGAQALGNLRTFMSLVPERDRPGHYEGYPDLLSSALAFVEWAKEYDKAKGRDHIAELHKKQLKYGFESAIELESQREEYGVILPKDPIYADDLCQDDWVAIHQAWDNIRSAAHHMAKQNDYNTLNGLSDIA